MNFCPASLPARWLGLAALVAAMMPAAAQQTIQFTKPADPDLLNRTNAFQPTSSRRNPASAFNAPKSLFGDNTPSVNFDILPGSPDQGTVPNVNAARWRKILDDKKNWTLMTPEENMGIQTPEQIMGLPDSKADSELSREQRFLQREDRLAAKSATNSFHHPDAMAWRTEASTDPFNRSDTGNRFVQNLGGSVPVAPGNPRPIFNVNPDSLPGANPAADAAWANPFGWPAPLPKQTPEQLERMKSFSALLESSAPAKPLEPARFSYQPVAAPDPNLQTLPAFNPAGHSFSALENNSGKPTGITPLPSITGSRLPLPKKPAPLVQPPPWLSDSPQGFAPRPY